MSSYGSWPNTALNQTGTKSPSGRLASLAHKEKHATYDAKCIP